MAEQQIKQTIVDELMRQAEDGARELSVTDTGDGLDVDGVIDVEVLAAAVAGALAGGP